jgi:dUTP pyrophosphatase
MDAMTIARPSRVELLRLSNADGLPLPSYRTEGAAGFDLMAALAPDTVLKLQPMSRQLVPTGFALALPDGFEGQVRPRSGLAFHHGVTVLNAPGTIDCDYRGEILVLLVNLGETSFEIVRGLRIAQLVVAPVGRADLAEVRVLSPTPRGAGGFGSTGMVDATSNGEADTAGKEEMGKGDLGHKGEDGG